jgi:K+-sensing histidine kinase KdpD
VLNSLSAQRERLLVAAGLLLPLAASALLALVRRYLPDTDAALVLVVVVVAVASAGRRTAGYLAAMSAAVWFDFFLTVPYYHFQMTHGSDIRTAVLLLLVGIAVTEIGVAARRYRLQAGEESELLALVSSVASQAAGTGSGHELIDRVSRDLVSLLGVQAVRFERGRPATTGRPRFEPDGGLSWGDVQWDIDTMGLPADDIELAVRADDVGLGRFVVTPRDTQPCPRGRRVVAVVLAEQVGAALARRPRALSS